MDALRLLSALVIFSIWASCTSAEHTPNYQRALAATASEFPRLDFIWANAEGDLDGDGLPDLALVLTGNRGADGLREERLIVLVGKPDGSYKILSVSDEFCHVRKFYNLSTSPRGGSFEVEGFSSEDASHSDSFTLKFRYNVNLNDFELIGDFLDFGVGQVRADNIECFVAFVIRTHLLLPLGKARGFLTPSREPFGD